VWYYVIAIIATVLLAQQHPNLIVPEDAIATRDQAAALRARATALAAAAAAPDPPTPATTPAAIHELQLHQIELEMQNEELRRTQHELEAAHIRYSDLYNLAPVGYCMLNEHGLILDANLTAAMLLGVAHGALLQQPLARFICSEDHDQYCLLNQQLNQDGTPLAYELRMLKNGVPFWARLEATIQQSNGNAPVTLVVLSNIAAHKQSEEQTAQYLALLSTIWECIHDGILCVDVTSKRIIVTNTAICNMLGYTRAELLLLAVQDLHPPEQLAQIFINFDRMAKTASLATHECPMQRKDGSLLLAEIVGTRGTLADHQCLIGVVRDVTARKQAEADKASHERAQQQLQKTESLQRMAGAIAHHFNNKLMAVMGNLELALEAVPCDTALAELLTSALKASGAAAEVSQQMLTYLGMEHGQREPLDLTEVCRRHVADLQASLPGTIHVQTDLPCPGPVISANAHQLQRVLSNLVANAGEAIGDHHGALHLTIRTVAAADIPTAHRWPIGWQPDAPAYACLTVADTGRGIAAAHIGQLFDPFFTTKFTGRGLGLSFVLGITRAHRGAVSVESVVGQGCTFRIFLPVTAEEIPGARARAATPRA